MSSQANSQVQVAIVAQLGKGFTEAFTHADKRMQTLGRTAADLNRKIGDVGAYRRQQNALKDAATAYTKARENAAKLRKEIADSEKPTRKQQQALQAAERAAVRTGAAYGQARTKLAEMRNELERGGVATNKLTAEYRRLQGELSKTTTKQDALEKSLNRQHKLVNGMASTWRGIAAAAAGVTAGIATAQRLGAPIKTGVNDAKSLEGEKARISALGLGKDDTDRAIKYGLGLKTYGTSRMENLTLTRDALSVFGDLHHAEMAVPMLAKMKFGNHAIYGDEKGGDTEAKFMNMLKVIELRGGTKSMEDFTKQGNMVQKVLSATGGRVGPDEWKNLISTGGLAAKAMRDDAFYYQLEPLVQEMGGDKVGTGLMSSYSALYQGRTTAKALGHLKKYGLVPKNVALKAGKNGNIEYEAGSLLRSDLFKKSQYEWMKQVLIPQLAKGGVTDKDKVLDVIGSLYSNRKGADLMAAMYLQTQQIDKNEKMNRGAWDIDQIYGAAQGTTFGKEMEAKAKVADAELNLGNNVLPAYTSAVEGATSALQKLIGIQDSSPGASKAVAYGAVGAAAAGSIGSAVGAAWGANSILKWLQGRGTAAAGGGAAEAGAGAAAAAGAGRFAKFGRFMKGGLIAGALGYASDTAAGALGAGGNAIDEKQDDANWNRMNWWQKGQSGFARGIEKTGSLLFLDNIVNSARADRIKSETGYLDGQAAEAAKAAAAAASEAAKAAQVKPNVTITNTYSVQVTAPQPGAAELSAQLEKSLRDMQRKADADARASWMGGPKY